MRLRRGPATVRGRRASRGERPLDVPLRHAPREGEEGGLEPGDEPGGVPRAILSREGSGVDRRRPRPPRVRRRRRPFPPLTGPETGVLHSTLAQHRTTPTAAGAAPAAAGESADAALSRRRPALPLRLLLLAALLAAAIVLAVRHGAVPLSVGDVLDALLGRGDPATVTIVRDLRLPRALQAALVGAALALSGAAFQALLRNPLAEPYILGVSSGAAVGAVLAIVLGLAAVWAVPAAAFAGAALAIVLVFRVAAGAGAALDTRVLLLAGVVVAAFFNAVILLLLTFADLEAFRAAMFWMMGSHANATWQGVAAAGGYLLAGALVLLALARPLNLLAIGEETAAHLGTHVERTKLLAYAAASLLAAGGVAVSGVIGFVGLVVPHVVRLLWGGDHRALLPASALLGASFLVLTDLVARLVVRPTELPIGVVTAFVGVPFFVWLLRRGAR